MRVYSHCLIGRLSSFAALSIDDKDWASKAEDHALKQLKALKKTIGKLVAPDNLAGELMRHDFEELSISFHHVSALTSMPLIHKDPFDRMLAAQCLADNLTLVTRDKTLKEYGISLIQA